MVRYPLEFFLEFSLVLCVAPMAIAGRVLLGISSALALKLPTSATGPLGGKLSPSFSLPRGKNVILFDGVCNFCNRWVNFVLGEQPARSPRHAPRQHSY